MRLIDADAVELGFDELCRSPYFKHDVNAKHGAETLMDVCVRTDSHMPNTIDPETLPIVRQLREELARVTAERDAALGRKVYVTARYDGDGLTVYRHDAESLNDSRCVVMVKYTAAAANVGYSENGKDGPYKTVMNGDEFGVLTMANDVARALFGYAESKEARP